VLALRGALPEKQLSQLRKLARRITERLAQQLADRLRPALSGLSTARPTRRRSRRLDFARTLDTNLDTAYRRSDGTIALAPRRMIFRTPARRHMDWHLIFVVDVSGSMEASVIYSALVAAIFSALPAIDVRFFAFSTAVIDLSNSVDDPLALLMEVQVGGGTHIGLGLRAAREAIKNPSRTLVVLVTDFEEGVSFPEMLAEIRMLADSGAKLLGLAALDDDAKPRYHTGSAAAVVSAGMPVAAVSPERLAQWVGDQIRKGSS
jgi:Mg-chelatase subunit ChlD